MSEQERKAAFAVCAVIVIGVWFALQLLGGGTAEEAEEASPPVVEDATTPLVLGEEPEPNRPGQQPPASDRSGGRDPPGEEDAATVHQIETREDLAPGEEAAGPTGSLLRDAEAHARSFMEAFLRYEAEGATAPVRRAIAPLVNASLAQAILSDELRTTRGDVEGPGELVSVDGEPTDVDEVSVIATVEYDGKPSGILISVEKSRRRWLVTDVS